MDPSDKEAFLVRWKDLIGTGDSLSSINSVVVDAEAQASGVEVIDSGVDQPIIVADPETSQGASAVRFYLQVDIGSRELPVYEGSGLAVEVSLNCTTANGRVLERSATVTIRQLG